MKAVITIIGFCFFLNSLAVHAVPPHTLVDAVQTGLTSDLARELTNIQDPAVLNEPIDDSKTTLMHFTARRGLLDKMILLLKAGAKIDLTDAEGKTPLHWAAQAGAFPPIHELLKNGSDPAARDHHQRTPIHFVVNAGDIRSLHALLLASRKSDMHIGGVHPGDVNLGDKGGFTPLHIATLRGFSAVVHHLLNAGANPLLRTTAPSRICTSSKELCLPAGTSALHLAALLGQPTIINQLLEMPGVGVTDLDDDENTPFHLALREGHFAGAVLLLGRGSSLIAINRGGQTAYSLALTRGHIETVELLNKLQVPPTERSMTED